MRGRDVQRDEVDGLHALAADALAGGGGGRVDVERYVAVSLAGEHAGALRVGGLDVAEEAGLVGCLCAEGVVGSRAVLGGEFVAELALVEVEGDDGADEGEEEEEEDGSDDDGGG